ncbi:MAG: hypothetical protein CVU94_00160 [Firmicutes bacterium HGW-Firmicutes-19]|nr:MAG: hypothetical protein CVU94_00160 [Firmicutes bacterium HGW-Firmicutes-19]
MSIQSIAYVQHGDVRNHRMKSQRRMLYQAFFLCISNDGDFWFLYGAFFFAIGIPLAFFVNNLNDVQERKLNMEILDCMKKRRSVRSFSDQKVSDEIISDMLEAARLAPSGGNGQSWMFGVIRDETLKNELAVAAGEQMWIARAPVVIACCAVLNEDLSNVDEDDFGLIVNHTRFGKEFVDYVYQYPDKRMSNIFWNNGVPAIPGEHMFLVATCHGLNACWIGYLDVRKASEILNLPDDVVCLYLMPVGYADQPIKEIERKSAEEISFVDRWK